MTMMMTNDKEVAAAATTTTTTRHNNKMHQQDKEGKHVNFNNKMSSESSGCSFSTSEHLLLLLRLILYYICGTLHELSHLICSQVMMKFLKNIDIVSKSSWLDVLFFRSYTISLQIIDDNYDTTTYNDNDDDSYYYSQLTTLSCIIRHTGWIFSLILALTVEYVWFVKQRNQKRNNNDTNSNSLLMMTLRWATWITAIEAISTDLFQLGGTGQGGGNGGLFFSNYFRLPLLPYETTIVDDETTNTFTSTTLTFFCGNFGIIFLHSDWYTTEFGRQQGLDLLEKMISITMMRGAQTGGVVTWMRRSGSGSKYHNQLTGLRSRVVNNKRSDLSIKVRKKIEFDSKMKKFGSMLGGPVMSNDFPKTYFGHTRFATSSIANFDGTHPHQWTPPMLLSVFRFDTVNESNINKKVVCCTSGKVNNKPQHVSWENFITHNGDLDFYQIQNIWYGLDTIQSWLTKVTNAPMPSSVDSVAIAGLIDLLHTQGCFALSARYAILFKLPESSSMDVQDGKYPNLNMIDYSNITIFFERALITILEETNHSLDTISTLIEEREFLIDSILSMLHVEIKLEINRKKSDDPGIISKFIPYLFPKGFHPTTTTSDDTIVMDDEDDNDNDNDDDNSNNNENNDNDDEETGGDVEEARTTTTAEANNNNKKSTNTNTAAAAAMRMMSISYDDTTLHLFVRETINAFFDNDLVETTKIFLSNAKGSFGVGVTSSITAHRQLCLASRGQTVSVAFYPSKGIVCYGSEQAATRAGLSFETPGGDLEVTEGAEKAIRLDLDDLNGEVLLLDWGPGGPQVSPPNQHWPAYKIMDGKMNFVLIPDGQNSVPSWSNKLHERMTLLEGHEFVNPLPPTSDDPVLSDIQSIPRICRDIQDEWRGLGGENKGSLNRLTAWNLTLCLKARLNQIADGAVERGPKSVDILLTGCEVSLWVAEQFASDLQKAFPKLGVRAVSSNKLLGLFGQDLSVPAVGYPMSEETHDVKDAIVIIVSQSGGTFGPLCCSNLMKSFSRNLFVVTSEWDTQVAKQLRSLHTEHDHFANSRIFATNCGFRTAEPSSISVAATHQLLTNIFEHISIVVLSNPTFRTVTGALITEQDLRELERCNQENIAALEEIVGVDSNGHVPASEVDGKESTEKELRDAGNLWAEHVLEGTRAYIMLGIYVFVTVTTGYPLIRAIATGLHGGAITGPLTYLIGFFDACIYFWFTQIAITLIRWWQGRNYLHRMVGRTVVIADIPWVSQAAESFLSKLFACSYSIAGLNVISGNPADHLVHRHTHRVVRGSLLLCGRPDGRLSALTSLETSTCLAVNQACSIQSLGGTCEAITIGHNPFKLPLSKLAIFLNRHRPEYLCERVTGEIDTQDRKQRKLQDKEQKEKERQAVTAAMEEMIGDPSSLVQSSLTSSSKHRRPQDSSKGNSKLKAKGLTDLKQREAASYANKRSAAALQGAYLALAKETARGQGAGKTNDPGMDLDELTVDMVIHEMVDEKRNKSDHRATFNKIDKEGSGKVLLEEFMDSYKRSHEEFTENQIKNLFEEYDGGKGYLTYEDFVKIAEMPAMKVLRSLQSVNRPRNLLQVEASKEKYFGETLRHDAPSNMTVLNLEKSQRFSMELYESRCASLQRFVSMTVMFHQLGKRVEQFFPKISFGIFGYRMDRSHSITRIQTTASPVSGAEVRERIKELELRYKVTRAVEKISFAWFRFRTNRIAKHAASAMSPKRGTAKYE